MHQQAYDYFVRWFAPKDGDRVLEVGSMDINSTQQGLVLRNLGLNTEWVGIDLEEGPSVDIVVKPDEPWPFESESFNWVLLPEMLEHDANPSGTLDKVYNVLKPNGWLILTTAAGGRQYHNPPHYWNFWPEGIVHLVTLSDLKVHHVQLLGLDIRCCGIRI